MIFYDCCVFSFLYSRPYHTKKTQQFFFYSFLMWLIRKRETLGARFPDSFMCWCFITLWASDREYKRRRLSDAETTFSNEGYGNGFFQCFFSRVEAFTSIHWMSPLNFASPTSCWLLHAPLFCATQMWKLYGNE